MAFKMGVAAFAFIALSFLALDLVHLTGAI